MHIQFLGKTCVDKMLSCSTGIRAKQLTWKSYENHNFVKINKTQIHGKILLLLAACD